MRYSQLEILIQDYKPRHIVEIGTWNGDRAIRLATVALKYQANVHYVGYDLFEAATANDDSRELNVKPHNTIEAVAAKLKAFREVHSGFSFDLIPGDTRYSLKAVVTDFAYIDGGHSIGTIQSDLNRLQGSRVIVLDDYYLPDEQGSIPDTSLYGCNSVIANSPHVVLPLRDRIKDGGYVMMALIGPPISVLGRAKLAYLSARKSLKQRVLRRDRVSA
jgi:hypothetical protein